MTDEDNDLLTALKDRFDLPVEDNPDDFLEALTHSSYRNENDLDYDNERLEFLGDAILELIAGEFIFLKFGQAQEGRLSKIKSAVVNTNSLYEIALKLNLRPLLRLGVGEQKAQRGLQRELADAVEALTAAVYLTSGLEITKQFILPYLKQQVTRYLEEGSKNYKGRLLEAVQRTWNQYPTYQVETVSGPEHAPKYRVNVQINDEIFGRGTGTNKKDAEQSAAQQALESLQVDNNASNS